MSEDDLRNFPMATRDDLQTIRSSAWLRDIEVNALLKVIAHAVQAAETSFSRTGYKFDYLEEDWLDCRLALDVWDLTWGESWNQEWPKSIHDIVTINNGNIITPCHSRDLATWINLVRRLRDLSDYDPPSLWPIYPLVCTYACGTFLY